MAQHRFTVAFEKSFLFQPRESIACLEVQELDGFSTSSLADSPFFETHKVSAIRLDESRLKSTYDYCSDYFRKRGAAGFYWLLSELSMPANLGRELQQLGATHGGDLWGMRLATDTPLTPKPLVDLEIRELLAADESNPIYQQLIEESYGAVGSGMGESMMKLTRQFRQVGSRIYTYVAYDGQAPVAFSCLVVLDDGITALLCGSGTLEAYRGRGIYGNMLEVRKAKALQLGCTHLMIQAKEETSAPIAKKHGFEHHCTAAIYKTIFQD